MSIIHIIKRKFGNRLALLALTLFQTVIISATDKVYISDFSIKPGETKTIAVNFDTDAANTRYIEGYIEVPEGLTVVNQNEELGTAVKYMSPNGERGVTNTSFSPNATKKVLVMSYVTITPGEGAVGYIKVAASSALAATSTIIVRDFMASQNDNTKRTCQTGNATVTRETTDEEKLVFSFSPATLTMKAGEEKQVEVQMENGMSLTGLQSSLSVSDGLTITGVTKGERMTYGWYYSSETNNILHIGNITGNEGTVFTVSLKANSNYTGTGTLTISNIHATTSESKDYAHADIILPVTVEQVGNAALSFGTAKVYLGAGESTTVNVNLTSDTDLTGFQCTLTLPDNITATVGKGALLNSTPLYNSETGNILYIDAVGINGHAGQLFTLTLTASDAFAADGTLTLTGIHSTTASSADIASEDITMQVAIKTNPSATAPTTKTLTYNGTAQELVNAGTATGGELQYSLDGTNYSTTIPTATNAGNYTIYYKVLGDAAHNDMAAATLTVTIAKAALTVTAEDKTATYGEETPAYTATYAGFVNNETAAVLTGTLAFDCDYTPSSNIGDYAITPKGLTAANYDITFVTGTLTVTKTDAAVTTAPTAKTLTYTGVAQALVQAGTAMGGTLQYKLNDGTYAAEIPTAVNAGTYTVTYQVIGDANHNDVAGTTLTITISKAALTVTAEDKTVNYGEATPEFTATYAGFVNNETAAVLTGTLAFDCDYTPSSNIGDYAITPKGLTAANYDITFVAGTLTITKAANFTITLAESSYIYDGTEKKPAVTVMDGSKVLTESTDYTVAYTNNINASTNAKVTVTGKGNYDGTKIATFTISKAALTVTAEDKTATYGEEAPAYTATYAGFVNNETAAVLTGTLVFDCDYSKGSNVGTYAITPKGLTAANYDITFVAGTLTVNKADAAMTTAPTIKTLTYTGVAQALVQAGTAMGGTLQYKLNDGTYAAEIPTAVNAGTYTVTYQVIGDANHYDVAGTTLTITISKAALTVTAEAKTVNYGEATPEFTATYAGFVNNETAAVLTGTLAFDCDYSKGSNVGTYAITPKGLTAANYDITFVAGTLTVNKAQLTSVTLSENSLTYTGNAQTVSVTNVMAGSLVVSANDYTVSGNTATEAGTYTVTVTAKEESNFTGSATAQWSIVASAPSTFVISSITPASFVYDGTEKKPTVTVMDGTTVLTEGTDYTVAYQNNVNAGTATVVVTGMGNYSGTQTATFTIAKAVLTSVTLVQTRLDYNGSEQSVSIASVKAGTIDVPTTDYTVSGNTATEVGTYTVTVTAKEESNFTGSVCTDFEIVQNETPELKFAIVVTDENDEVIDGTTATVTTLDEGGNAVSIDKLNVPAGNEGKSLKVYIPEQLGGYDVAAIANNAFADKDVIDVFLPDTEKSLTVGSNAIPRLATIHTTLALLDDYALMATLKPNYEAHLVMTTVKPANNYWTLGTGVDVIIPTELTIATVQQKNASEVSVCNISEEDLNMGGKRVVKSNNGVLLEGTAGESYDLVAYSGRMASGTAITTDDHKDYGADNCLEPVVEKKHYEPGAYFVMSDNEFHAIKQEGEEIKVPAGKAVLHLTGRQSSYAPVLRLSFDSSADGISTVQSNAKEMVCYDLLGRRIQNGQQKGLIIKNGKKTIVSKR